MPAAHNARITLNPNTTPNICGKERIKPKRMPDEVSMMLFGPGVIDETKANNESGSRDSIVFHEYGKTLNKC